ncbi:endonuclease 8-like 3 isoform X2 [Macrobrachium rosenbergii]|uniref:endonuclease 8-like 3 isoform X2 n=1 Tax=Macrobrachium rosenbergii TaxID=79674 RepID=UPI0034D750D1
MVEGPGCKLNGLKLKKRAKGQRVNAVSGNVIVKRSGAEKAVPSHFEQLIGLVLLDVKTLGKELFALFENDVCLRVHFLMQGSVRSCAESIERHDLLIDLDICSPTFDAKRAVQTILEHPERLVCDVILDQLVLPGVGNIIKNEALFDAGINPNTKVKDLSEELVSHLVKMNRDFTSIFYKCRKEGKNLRKHMRVYEKENCPECGGKLTRCKIGEYERLTFFCRFCQVNSIKTHKKLAVRNSLLGWVQASKIQVPWNCSVCTLENKPANSKCVVCFTPKATSFSGVTSGPTASLQNPSLASEGNEDVQISPAVSPHLITSSASPATEKNPNTIHRSGKRPLDTTPGKICKIGKYTFKRTSDVSSETSSPMLSLEPSPSIPKLQGSPVFVGSNAPGVQHFRKIFSAGQDEDTYQKDEEQIVCSGHRKPVKKAVVKQGENRGRVFYACSLPQMKQCKFFLWADDDHPLCCHGRITVIRTVMKLNSNNGRQFYCCSLPKPKQCDFFEWVSKTS